MGCCFSISVSRDTHTDRVVAPEEPAAATAPRSAAISNTTTTTTPRTTTLYHPARSGPSATARVVVRTAPDDFPLGEPFNAPIRPHVWYSKRRLWTRAQLDHERREFFETRVTGRPEIWAALATALALMQAGDLDTAQGIVDAAGITVPTGDFCQGAYDQHGVLYRLPQCIVSDPENMLAAELADEFDTDDDKMSLDEASGDELIAEEEEEVERRRDEKGKASERDVIRVRARLSDRGGPDVVVAVKTSHSVGFIARKIQQDAGIPRTQRVRIVYLGKMLREHASLVDQGWKSGHVVNALVVARNPL
ncbi:predicted protein [Aspergillus terreus NIH2624]|uniref:Ubiquitin-like domain-containing protein n=1 Tax=Aspergillus terreus (strain NIH 2624 / FGSC A1156) TaxID=341663 RepID=Q0D179_ASPTN|nr:uncharacterized protein ATEG_00305 [Aspergillus terreus NIH2624]EAU38951.1 predicted protein [Aspergillus terreus NIH2624]